MLSFMGCDEENKIEGDEKNKPTADSIQISVVLNYENLSLYVGENDTLMATVRNGDNIVDYKVTWSSDGAQIAVVDSNGVVTALSVGTAVITATYQGVNYTCKVVVTERPIVYEYVDLGLSVNWATFNVGATKPEEFGDYYAWGETEPKTDYSWETYKWCNGSETTLTKYCNNSEYGYNGYTDYKYVLDLEDDVAHVKWGGNWRMPTREEIEELTSNCSWRRESVGDVDGFRVTGPSGNSIFIPAAGYYSGTEWIEAEYYENGHDGDFWSSTPGDDYKSYFIWCLTGRQSKGVTQYDRYRGWSVRPVCTLEAAPEESSKHEYVDLGLSVKWATCNIGATKPGAYSYYYAWGETKPKTDYSWETYKWCNGSYNALTKYCSDSSLGNDGFADTKTTLDLEDDVAHDQWGGSWRMPTSAEWDELLNNCTWTWYDKGNREFSGMAGYKATSKIEGYTDRFIFLPANSYLNGPEGPEVGSQGLYWSSSLGTDASFDACIFRFYLDHVRSSVTNRNFGLSVRPVCP